MAALRAAEAPGGLRTFALIACCSLAACGSEDATRPSGVVAEVSENVATVVNVRWSTEEASIGYVEYGPTRALEFNTPLEADDTEAHALSLLGLHEDTVYYYRVVTWDGADAAASDIKSIRTGTLPGGLPSFTVEGEGHDQFTLVPILGSTTAVVIIDPEGKIVWYHSDERELQFYRARLSLDGKSVLYNAATVSGDPAADSELVRVALDGSTTSSIPVPLLAHDFVEHPDGTLAAIVVEYRDFEGVPLRGDKIVEIDPSGNQTTVWSAWDCFDPALDPGDNIELGWTFANALDFNPIENAYYLGMRNFSSITKIDRATGSCEWVLGFSAATLEFSSSSSQFLHQHQFDLSENRLLVMDNEGSLGAESRLLEYELDFEANIATEVWSYVSTPSVETFVLGEPTRLDGGDIFVTWSTAGQMERVTPEKETIWKLNSRAGFAFGFHTLADSLYSAHARNP